MSLAKASKKKQATLPPGKPSRKPYSDDEIDAFQAEREKISLMEEEQDDMDFSDLDEEAVLDLPSTDDDDDEGEGGEYDDGKEDDGSEPEEGWGRNRKTFYSADVEPEDLKDEAREAKRLQKRQLSTLGTDDYGICSDGLGGGVRGRGPVALSLSDSEEEEEPSDHYVSESELVNIDGDKLEELLPETEKLELVKKHAPEVKQFLKEFKSRAEEVRTVLEPALLKLRASNTDKGLSFLESKYQLLVGYCANLAYYLLLKVRGQSVERHPVVERLVKYRLLLEKMKPMEAKLQYQVDKLLQATQPGGRSSKEDLALAYRPNLSLMRGAESSSEGEAEGRGPKLGGFDEEEVEADGLYRAPKLAPAHFVEKRDKNADRLEEREKMLASRSRLLADMQAELEDRPEEDSIDPVYARSLGINLESERQRERYEEDNFVRFTLSKKEQRRLERLQAKPIDELEDLNDFFRETTEGSAPTNFGKSAMGRILRTKLADPRETGGASGRTMGGDDDVPVRRAKRGEGGRTRQQGASPGADAADDMSEIEEDVRVDVFDDDDELYKEAKGRSASKRRREGASHQQQSGHSNYRPIRDAAPGERRPATYEMLKNRGLTPSRPKDVRNPRLHQRKKWEKAQKRIKSFKQVASSGPARPYSGEATGIRTSLTRSVKF